GLPHSRRARGPDPVLTVVPLPGNGSPHGRWPCGAVVGPGAGPGAGRPGPAPRAAGVGIRVARTGHARTRDARFSRPGAARVGAAPRRDGGAQARPRERGGGRVGGPHRGAAIGTETLACERPHCAHHSPWRWGALWAGHGMPPSPWLEPTRGARVYGHA